MSLLEGNSSVGGDQSCELLEQIGVKTTKSLVDSQACKIGQSNLHFMVPSLFSEPKGEDLDYDIYLVEQDYVTSDLVAEMKMLQDKICHVQAPDPSNPVDYKTEQEFADHFALGGQAIVFAAGDKLLGCCMLSEEKSTGLQRVFSKSVDDMPDIDVLKVGFLAVDPDYEGYKLATRLLDFAKNTAKVDGYNGIEAGVRLWNTKAIKRFSGSGFIGSSISQNPKDGCQVLKMGTVFDRQLKLDSIKGWEKLMDSPADQVEEVQKSLDRGGILAWHGVGQKVAIYSHDSLTLEG